MDLSTSPPTELSLRITSTSKSRYSCTSSLSLPPSCTKVKHTTIKNLHELYLWQHFKITDTKCFTDNKPGTNKGEIRKSDTDSRLF